VNTGAESPARKKKNAARSSAKFQLVLQFRGQTLADFDALISIEDRMIAELGRSVVVDGHDFGSGTGNIFIITSDPELTFWRARHALKSDDPLQLAAAAYRPLAGENITVLWPKGAQTFSII
jgi:hypothetical protein